MRNYIRYLPQKDRQTLCELFGSKNFKDFFKDNEWVLSEIDEEISAKSLTKQQALNIAISNTENSYISNEINKFVDFWLTSVKKDTEELEGKEVPPDIALAMAILDSLFSYNVDLYLKLTKSYLNKDKAARNKLHEIVEIIRFERTRNSEIADRIKSKEEENRQLLTQIENLQFSANSLKKDNDHLKKEKDAWIQDQSTWEHDQNTWKQDKNAWEQAKHTWEQDKSEWRQDKNAWKQDREAWRQARESWEKAKKAWEQDKNTSDALLAIAQEEIDFLKAKLNAVTTTADNATANDATADNATSADTVTANATTTDTADTATSSAANLSAESELKSESASETVLDQQEANEQLAKCIAAHIADSLSDSLAKSNAAVTPSASLAAPSPQAVVTPYHLQGEDIQEFYDNHSWDDVVDTAASKLVNTGVAEAYSLGLAAFLCAAYIEKQPLLLIGPQAIDIAKALCAAIIGDNKYGMLYCEDSYSHQVLTDIGAHGEDIVLISNLLASGWMNRLPEIIAHKAPKTATEAPQQGTTDGISDQPTNTPPTGTPMTGAPVVPTTGAQQGIFYIATHPYAEDIQVEPKSLYGFMLPLFTEFFVTHKASETNQNLGGYISPDFQPYDAAKAAKAAKLAKAEHLELKVLTKFNLRPLVKNKINSLIATMHEINPTSNEDDEFLFAILPIAYASMAMDELTEAIQQGDIAISKSLKRELRYILGEV